MNVTTLDALLLFLVGQKSQSGYDIRQMFQATPLGMFSDSPGSIYPSLARLEARGLLTSSAAAEGRRRRSYKRTAAGQKALTAWLDRPVDAEAGKREPAEMELRFVMIAETLGAAKAAQFLEAAKAAYVAELKALETYMAGPGKALGTASKASVDLGMRIVRLRIDWCQETKIKLGRRS